VDSIAQYACDLVHLLSGGPPDRDCGEEGEADAYSAAEQGQKDGFGKELDTDMAFGGTECSMQSNLASTHQHRDNHDVCQPHSADQQSDGTEAQEERVKGALGVGTRTVPSASWVTTILVWWALGVLSTVVYASTKGWAVVVPVLAWGGGFGAALLIGAVAGLLPALRAARMSPTEARYVGWSYEVES
jgi:hypothetical protein